MNKGEPVDRIFCAISLLVLFAVGCDGASPGSQVAEPLVQDSAGVTVVVFPGQIRDYATPNLKLEPLFRIGEDESGLNLFRVAGARFLSSGALVIANAGVPELLLVDSEGDLVRRVGRQGEGPGEFGTITSLHVQGDGSFLTYDDRLARLTGFDQSGEVLSTRRMTDPNPISDLIPLLVSPTGTVLAINGDNRVFGRNGERQDSTPLLQFSPQSSEPDTLSVWPTKTWRFLSVGPGTSRTQVPFSPDLLSAGRGPWAALATTHDPVITELDGHGTIRRSIRWEEEGRAVSGRDFEQWQEERLSAYPDAIPEGTRQQMVDLEPYPTHPVIEGIFLDAEGAVWIAPSSLSSGSNRKWIRVTAEGKPEGAIALPLSAEILDAANGRMAVLDKDELDVEVITVFRIEGE